MSRCFPYPPPGFERSLASIEPIKIRKESEKAERERKKEKKREKKEKKVRGDKERAGSEKHKKRRYSELSHHPTQKTAGSAKATEDDSEQLEKSSLTEERGCPAAVQSLCDSSDSTQNSSKRSKHESAGIIRIAQGGNGLRIRLPLLRHVDTTESPLSIQRPCFSGRSSDTVLPPRQETRQETKAVVRFEQPCSSVDDRPCFSGRTSTVAPSGEAHQDADRSKPATTVKPPTASGAPQHQKSANATDSCRLHRRSHRRSGSSSSDRETRRLYKKLVLEWSPPPPGMEPQAPNPEDDDHDWLFGGKNACSDGRRQRQQQEGEGGAAAVGGVEAGLGGAALCSWPPRAWLVPEVGMYALPYVVPF